jgi:hypothetical protein
VREVNLASLAAFNSGYVYGSVSAWHETYRSHYGGVMSSSFHITLLATNEKLRITSKPLHGKGLH